MKAKLFSAVAVMALVAPAALTLGSASAAINADNVSGTSTATFDVLVKDTTDPTSGVLTLKSVPDFNFGTVKGQDIYDGKTGIAASADGALAVSDLRTGAADDWKLSAQMTAFTGSTTGTVNGSLDLAATNDKTAPAVAGNLATTATAPTSLAESTDGAHGTTTYNFAAADNKLNITGDAAAKLTDGDTFTSTITWTLTTNTPNA